MCHIDENKRFGGTSMGFVDNNMQHNVGKTKILLDKNMKLFNCKICNLMKFNFQNKSIRLTIH